MWQLDLKNQEADSGLTPEEKEFNKKKVLVISMLLGMDPLIFSGRHHPAELRDLLHQQVPGDVREEDHQDQVQRLALLCLHPGNAPLNRRPNS